MAFFPANLASIVSHLEKTVDKALNISEEDSRRSTATITAHSDYSESEFFSTVQSVENQSIENQPRLSLTSESQVKSQKKAASEDEFFGQFLGNQTKLEKTTSPKSKVKPARSSEQNSTEQKRPINGVKSTESSNSELNNSHEVSQDQDASSKEEIQRLQEILTQRETQILSLNQENMTLNEKIEQLSREIDDFKRQNPDLDLLKSEFMKRLSEAEKQVHEACRERDQLRLRLKNADDSKQRDLKMAELEESNAQLIKEGEKLAQEQAKDRKKIKEMKAKETLLEKQKEDLNLQLKEALDKMEGLYVEIKSLERYKESGLKVQEIGEIHARKVSELEAQIKESEIRDSTLKSSLERAYKEISDLRKVNLEAMEIAHSEALEKEIKKNEEMHELLRIIKKENEDKESAVRKELLELRSTIQRNEDQSSWREENFRREITNLQERLLQSDLRNKELVSSFEEMSQPLMRQIESLQNQANQNYRVWQQTESSLHYQLQQAISEKSEVAESSKILNEKIIELSGKMSSVTTQLTNERKEKNNIISEFELLREKLVDQEKKLQELNNRLENERAGFARTLQEVRSNDQRSFLKQLQDEKMTWERKLEEEIQKIKTSQEILSKKEAYESSEKQEMIRSSSTMSLSSVAMEKMVSNIRFKEDEVYALRDEIKKISEIRDSLAAQLLKESEEKDRLLKESDNLVFLKANLDDLAKRHEVALDLLGEKTEELEEVRSDMAQLKQLFRDQVSQLLDEIEKLKASRK